MSFDWSQYLEIAQLMGDGSGGFKIQEAKLRTGISRAYYAAFKTAFNFLRDKRGDRMLKKGMERRSIHQYVRNQFDQSTQAEEKSIGILLGTLVRGRTQADYEDDFGSDIPKAHKTACELAERVILKLSSLN